MNPDILLQKNKQIYDLIKKNVYLCLTNMRLLLTSIL